jgi:hypothetical protein
MSKLFVGDTSPYIDANSTWAFYALYTSAKPPSTNNSIPVTKLWLANRY